MTETLALLVLSAKISDTAAVIIIVTLFTVAFAVSGFITYKIKTKSIKSHHEEKNEENKKVK